MKLKYQGNSKKKSKTWIFKKCKNIQKTTEDTGGVRIFGKINCFWNIFGFFENIQVFNFSLNFLGFGLRKRNQNQSFFVTFSKISILWKLSKTIEKTMVFNVFQVSSLQKTTQYPCKNTFEKNIEKKPHKNRFSLPFWPPKTSENQSKILRNWSAKRRGTKLVSRRYGTRPELGGKQRKSSFVKRPDG